MNQLPTMTYIKVSEYVNKTKNFLNKLFIVSILIYVLLYQISLIVKYYNAVHVIGIFKSISKFSLKKV